VVLAIIAFRCFLYLRILSAVTVTNVIWLLPVVGSDSTISKEGKGPKWACKAHQTIFAERDSDGRKT
jgi:hypothetical protein